MFTFYDVLLFFNLSMIKDKPCSDSEPTGGGLVGLHLRAITLMVVMTLWHHGPRRMDKTTGPTGRPDRLVAPNGNAG